MGICTVGKKSSLRGLGFFQLSLFFTVAFSTGFFSTVDCKTHIAVYSHEQYNMKS